MKLESSTGSAAAPAFVEDVEIRGHIIDSLILPKVLDLITSLGGTFCIKQIAIGQARADASHALVEVQAPTAAGLAAIIAEIADHGALPTVSQDCRLEPADMDAAFPEGFYSTTNQRTEVRLAGKWCEIDLQEMDCGIVVSADRKSAKCLPMVDVRRGDLIVVGHAGVRVFPPERAAQRHLFEFMGSSVSTEKPKTVAIRAIARELSSTRAAGGRTLLVGGPAIVHTGSGAHICQMIRDGYIDLLFAGNALATHDIEQALFGTSLGVHLTQGTSAEAGHEHHLRRSTAFAAPAEFAARSTRAC